MKPTFAVLTLSLSIAASSADADVLFQNPWNSFATDEGAFSDEFQQLAGEFVLGSNADVNRATWYGTMYSSDPLDTGDTWNFDIRFYSDSGGFPGGLLASEIVVTTVIDTGVDVDNERSYLFDATFPDVALHDTTAYWFSVLSVSAPGTFRWTEATSGLDSAIQFFPGQWIDLNEDNRNPLNFALYGREVPEPSSLTLLGLGLLGLGFMRRRS